MGNLLDSLYDYHLLEYKLGKIYFERLDLYYLKGTFKPDFYFKLKEELLKNKKDAWIIKNEKMGVFGVFGPFLGLPSYKEFKFDNYDVFIMTDDEERNIFLQAFKYWDYCKSFRVGWCTLTGVLEKIPEKIYCAEVDFGKEIRVTFSHVDDSFEVSGGFIKKLWDLIKKLEVFGYLRIQKHGDTEIYFRILGYQHSLFLSEFPEVRNEILEKVFFDLADEILRFKERYPISREFLLKDKKMIDERKIQVSKDLVLKLISLLKISGEMELIKEKYLE